MPRLNEIHCFILDSLGGHQPWFKLLNGSSNYANPKVGGDISQNFLFSTEFQYQMALII